MIPTDTQADNTNNEVTTYEFIDLSAHFFGCCECPPPMLWGPPGVGKSALVRSGVMAISNNGTTWNPDPGSTPSGALEVINDWGLVDLRVSLREPTDLLGLPNPSRTVVSWAVPDELPVVGQEGRFPPKGILFLDELTHAAPAMQSACFSLVLDRRCGPHRLLPGWTLVAASNGMDENTQAFPMSAPLRNRFAHFQIKPSLDAFKKWAFANGVDARVIGFLNWNSNYLYQATDNPQEGFPTPRSWTYASRLLGRLCPEQFGSGIAACVGPGTAAVFIGFLDVNANSELNVDIAQLLRGKARAPKLSLEKPDWAWALTARITAAVQEEPQRLSSAIAFYCGSAWKDVREIGRTGLADLKYLVEPADFTESLTPHLEACHSLYGEMLQ